MSLSLDKRYYGPNNTFRVFNRFNTLTDTYKKRFKSGEVKELPPGWLYNTTTRRFYVDNVKNRTRFNDLNNVDGILQPASIFDYDMAKVDYRTIVQKYKTPKQRVKGPAEILNRSALQGWTGLKAYRNENRTGYGSIDTIGKVIPFLKKQALPVKYYITVYGDYLLNNEHRTIKTDSKPRIILKANEVSSNIQEAIAEIKSLIEEAQLNGSGYNFKRVKSFYLNYVKYNPTRGSSYIPLPFTSKNIINPKNGKDNECFKWCLAIHNAIQKGEKKDLQRVSKLKKHCEKYDLQGVEYPFSITKSNVKKVEDKNDISINVFHRENKSIYPLHISSNFTTDETKQINLLLITDNRNNKHFTYITNYNGLVSKQTNNTKRPKFHCHYCLHGFTTKTLLNNHVQNGCSSFGNQKTMLPTKDNNTLKFKNFNKQFKAPLLIYADFESVLQPTPTGNTHIPSGFCIYPVCINKEYKFKPILYTATNEEEQKQVIPMFYKELQKIETKFTFLSQKYKDISKMKITKRQKEEHLKATTCHICNKKIKDVSVYDHCHVTGQYRGKAHNSCNLNLNDDKYKIPVFFHNLKGYDSHFIIREMNKKEHTYTNKQGKEVTTKVDVVANNSEKYITFSFRKLQFLDTMAFLNNSLDKLVSTLVKSKGGNALKHTKTHLNTEMFELAQRKGVFPYEYITNINILNYTELPSKEDFYSKLSEKGITDSEYKHAHNVWTTGKMETLKEYHDFYLKTDVLLLADVFEDFRNSGMTSYNLDPARYWTLPGYSWDCMLKFTDINLELLTDIDMYQFCEKGIRGGVSLITHRYAKANNPYLDVEIEKLNKERKENNEPLLKKLYDPKIENSYIIYVDANNLYGGEGGMSGLLPYKDFEWIDPKDFHLHNDNEDKGYIVECDIEYPKELHNLHNDLPVAPENLKMKSMSKSKWQNTLKEEMNIKETNVGKLVPNLMNKEKYVCHSRNLKYYLRLGLKLTKIHRVLEFTQKRWLQPYINFNTSKRTECVKNGDGFGKAFYKLMNNAVFGKTMENVRNRIDYEITDDVNRAKKLTSCPRYTSHQIIRSETETDDGLVGFCRSKTSVELNKPVYVGLTILDNSKLTMYDFHYDYIKHNYGDKATLLFTDTDSLCYHIKTDDIYKDFKKDTNDRFDFSNYPKSHTNFNGNNESQLGKFVKGEFQGYFKDETSGIPIQEFCGIRSKCYSILLPGQDEKKTLKGIKKSAMTRIHHSDYKRCLFPTSMDDKRQKISFYSIRSVKHQVKTIQINKTSLSSYDDKRYIYDGIRSYSYGHYNIKV